MKKIIGGLLAVLVALTVVGPVLAAVQLKDYPGFLADKTATASSLATYVIVGADAATADVVGAVNLAMRLAELSYTVETVPGVPTVCVENCVEKEIPIGDSDVSNDFPSPLKQVHIAYLKDASLTMGAATKRYYEAIYVPAGQISNDYTLYNESVVLAWDAPANPWEYRLVFAEAFNATANGYGTAYPLMIDIMGKTFGITAFGSDSFTAQIGEKASLSLNVPKTIGDYTYTIVLGGQNWIRVKVEGPGIAAGGTIVSLTEGEEKLIPGTSIKIRLLNVWYSEMLSTIDADVIVGTETSKTFTTGDEWPDNPDWKFNVDIDPAGGNEVSADDFIGVQYKPDMAYEKYIKEDQKWVSPNSYMEILHDGFTVKKYASLTVKPATGITVYTEAEKPISDLSGVNGFEISSDNKIIGAGYTTAYIVFKKQSNSLNATLAYKNPAKGNKVIYDSSKLVADATASEPMSLAITFDASTYTLKLANKTAAYTAVGDYDPTISLLGYNKNVTGNFKLEGTVTTPSVKLGATRASVDSGDVNITGTPPTDISSQETDIVYDLHGSKIKTVKTNVLSDQLVFSLPADTVKVKIAVGKIEAVAGAGGTYNKIVPIRTAVSKLDTDADVATLKTTSHLVLVGGPCVNDLVAELAAAGKLKDKDGVTLTCEGWPGRNFGVISAIEDAFVPGKIAVVVAGTRADDTRAACAAAQKFEDYLSTVTTSSVEVGGTVTAPGPVTPY